MAQQSRNSRLFANSTTSSSYDGDFIDLTSENFIEDVVIDDTEEVNDPLTTDQTELNNAKTTLDNPVSIIPITDFSSTPSSTNQKILIPLRIENSASTGQYLLIDKSQVQQHLNVLNQAKSNSNIPLTKINVSNVGGTPTVQSKEKRNIIIHDHVRILSNNVELPKTQQSQIMSSTKNVLNPETTNANNNNCHIEKKSNLPSSSLNNTSLQTKSVNPSYKTVTGPTFQNMQQLIDEVRQATNDGKIILIGLQTPQTQSETGKTSNEIINLSDDESPNVNTKAKVRKYRSLPVTLPPEEMKTLTNHQQALIDSYCKKVSNSISLPDPLDDGKKPTVQFQRLYQRPKTSEKKPNIASPGQTKRDRVPATAKSQLALARNSQKVPDKVPKDSNAPRVIPVDITKILNKVTQPMPESRCKSVKSKKKNVYYRGFTNQEKRVPGCLKQITQIINAEVKKMHKLRAALTASLAETNFVQVRSSPNNFLPEMVTVEIDSDDDLQAAVYNSKTLPALSEVISDVTEEMKQLRRRKGERKGDVQAKLAKPEAALKLIKEGLELIKSWSKETYLAKEAPKKQEVAIVTPAKRRRKRKEDTEPPIKRRRRRRKNVVNNVHQTVRMAKFVECASVGDDDLLIVKKVDILNERR